MCSVIIARNRHPDWPVMIAANRDEMADRPWLPPARHWSDRQDVIAGLDEMAGGSWLGLNDFGVVAMILNRKGTLGPEAGKRSRGELVLEALDHADAAGAANALAALNGSAYRPFNLVICDNRDAYVLVADGEEKVVVEAIPEGISMITHADRNDRSSIRTRDYLPRFEAAVLPEPEAGDWQSWIEILSDRRFDSSVGPRGAMNIVSDTGFGTSSSALLALPDMQKPGIAPVFLFSAGRPDEVDYVPVAGLRSAQATAAQRMIV